MKRSVSSSLKGKGKGKGKSSSFTPSSYTALTWASPSPSKVPRSQAEADLLLLLDRHEGIRQRILAQLPKPDIASLGQTCKHINGILLNWILDCRQSRLQLLPCLKEVHVHGREEELDAELKEGLVLFDDHPSQLLWMDEDDSRADFAALGRMLKRITGHKTTSDRVDMVWRHIKKLTAYSCIKNKMAQNAAGPEKAK